MPKSICLDRDIDELFKARGRLVRRGKECRELSAIYLIRELTSTPDALLMQKRGEFLTLLIIPKRFVRKSHERHKLQRWLREAIRLSPRTTEIEGILNTVKKQALLGIRAERVPSKELNWLIVKADIEIILEHLLKAIERS